MTEKNQYNTLSIISFCLAIIIHLIFLSTYAILLLRNDFLLYSSFIGIILTFILSLVSFYTIKKKGQKGFVLSIIAFLSSGIWIAYIIDAFLFFSVVE